MFSKSTKHSLCTQRIPRPYRAANYKLRYGVYPQTEEKNAIQISVPDWVCKLLGIYTW